VSACYVYAVDEGSILAYVRGRGDEAYVALKDVDDASVYKMNMGRNNYCINEAAYGKEDCHPVVR
jgi:hypothetical protein